MPPHRGQKATVIVTGIPVGSAVAKGQDTARPRAAVKQQRLGGRRPDGPPARDPDTAEALEIPCHAQGPDQSARRSMMAPKAAIIWLRQSRMMKTTGSSCISPRRASTHMRRMM